MQKKELEQLLGVDLLQWDYNVIETIYLYHPAISEDGFKARQQILDMYKRYGMSIFRMLFSRAFTLKGLESDFADLQRQLSNMRNMMDKMDELAIAEYRSIMNESSGRDKEEDTTEEA